MLLPFLVQQKVCIWRLLISDFGRGSSLLPQEGEARWQHLT
jgi:phytoene/squalene synthetase